MTEREPGMGSVKLKGLSFCEEFTFFGSRVWRSSRGSMECSSHSRLFSSV